MLNIFPSIFVHLFVSLEEMFIFILHSTLNWVFVFLCRPVRNSFCVPFPLYWSMISSDFFNRIFSTSDSFCSKMSFFFTFTFFLASGDSLLPLGCGNTSVGRFHVSFYVVPRSFGCFPLGSLYPAMRLNQTPHSCMAQLEDAFANKILFSIPSMEKQKEKQKQNKTASLGRGQNFSKPSFTKRVPDLFRSLSFRSFSPMKATSCPSPPIKVILPRAQYHHFLLFCLGVSTSLLVSWDFLLFLWSLLFY